MAGLFERLAHRPTAWFTPTWVGEDSPSEGLVNGEPVRGPSGEEWRLEFAGPGHPVFDAVQAEVEAEDEQKQREITDRIAAEVAAQAGGRGRRVPAKAASREEESARRRMLRRLERRCLGWTEPSPDLAYSDERRHLVFTDSSFLWLQNQALQWLASDAAFFGASSTDSAHASGANSGRPRGRRARTPPPSTEPEPELEALN